MVKGVYDEVHPLVLKKCSLVLAIPLSIIFKKLLMQGRVSNLWRLGNVSPLFKKGSSVDRKNYRRVSLTSIGCKIMYGVIRDVFMSFLVKKQADTREAAQIYTRKELCHEFTRDLRLSYKRSICGSQS